MNFVFELTVFSISCFIGAGALLDATNPGQVINCPDDWVAFKDSCYAFIDYGSTFSEAAELCERFNGYLTEIGSSDENEFVKSLARNRTTSQVWIGGSDFIADGNWRWLFSREKIIFFDWAAGEPITGPTNRCIQLWSQHDFQWDDTQCQNRNMFVCETNSEGGPMFGK